MHEPTQGVASGSSGPTGVVGGNQGHWPALANHDTSPARETETRSEAAARAALGAAPLLRQDRASTRPHGGNAGRGSFGSGEGGPRDLDSSEVGGRVWQPPASGDKVALRTHTD